MTQWHADIDGANLSSGVKLTVASHHHVVRVVTADTLSIEAPSGQRTQAVILDRAGGGIRLMLDDGNAFTLEMLVDESLHPPPGPRSTVFSRQVWLTH
jgi:hypothetical protein